MLEKLYYIIYSILLKNLPQNKTNSLSVRLRIILLKKMGAVIGDNSTILNGADIYIPRNLTLGSNSGIGIDCKISCGDKVIIGDRVLMGPEVMIYTTDHIWSADEKTYYGKGLTYKPVIIEDDVWLGARSIILKGVHIGKGATIAAGTIVTKDVPKYSVFAGTPGKVIKYK